MKKKVIAYPLTCIKCGMNFYDRTQFDAHYLMEHVRRKKKKREQA